MMLFAALLAVSSIAFPKEGQSLPYVTRCYASGAVSPGVSNVVVQGRQVPVHPLGGWVTMIDVVEGENVLSVEGCDRRFSVARRPRLIERPTASPPPEKTYVKLPYAGDLPRPSPRERARSEITIVLDPGHGGSETGAMSPHGLTEADLNLALAKNIREELRALGFRVVMTRESDVNVPLYDRPKAAHRMGADAFVSVHHNAPPLDRDPCAIRYHAVYAWNPLGEELARAINRKMAVAFEGGLRDNGVLHANFAVTRSPEIPSCLIETDFITTPEGEIDCWDRARRHEIAAAIAAGIADWCR